MADTPTGSFENVTVDIQNGLATVTVVRPKVMNALNIQTVEELGEAFAVLASDDGVKGIVLTSSNGAFAGADIREIVELGSAAQAETFCLRGQKVLNDIAALRKPVVAAVNGPVLGGGCELCMATHARVVGEKLLLGQPEVNLGIIPGYGGTQRLPRLIGTERALDLLRTGRPVKAAQACEWGWATGPVVEDPVAEAKALLQRHVAGKTQLAPVSPSPLDAPVGVPELDIGHHSRAVDEILVRAVQEGVTKPLPEGLAVEAGEFGRCCELADFQIGMKNFLENGPRAKATFEHR